MTGFRVSTYIGYDGLAVVNGGLEVFDGKGADVALHGHASESRDAIPNNQVGVDVSWETSFVSVLESLWKAHYSQNTIVGGQPLVQASWIGFVSVDGDVVGGENHAHTAHGTSRGADGVVAAGAQRVTSHFSKSKRVEWVNLSSNSHFFFLSVLTWRSSHLVDRRLQSLIFFFCCCCEYLILPSPRAIALLVKNKIGARGGGGEDGRAQERQDQRGTNQRRVLRHAFFSFCFLFCWWQRKKERKAFWNEPNE